MKRSNSRIREEIAQEAARIMSQDMVQDFHQAKLKACARLGYSGKQALPANEEVQQALRVYLQVFKADEQEQLLKRLRTVALDAMRFLERFQPKLVGAVLHGTADQNSAVHLHVFADPVEQVLHHLLDRGVPYDLAARQVSYKGDRSEEITVCRFLAGDSPIELSLFVSMALREAPRSAVDGKPMHRAGIVELKTILQA